MPPTKRDQALAAARLTIEMADDLTKASVNGWVAKELIDEIDELVPVRDAARKFLDAPSNGRRGYNQALEDLITSLDSYEKRLDEREAARAG